MNAQLRTRSRGRRGFASLLLIPLLAVAAGCSTAATSAPAATKAEVVAGSDGLASGALGGAPVQAPGPATVGSPSSAGSGVSESGVASSGAGVAGSASAIAYPYPVYPGSPGVAPDHTIVVTGIGRAVAKADLSDQASAQQDALASALADGKAQADLVARAVGVTISGVLSVSVSSGEAYAVPLAVGAAGAAPGTTQGGPGTVVPPIVPVEPSTQQIMVSVTVAYRIS